MGLDIRNLTAVVQSTYHDKLCIDMNHMCMLTIPKARDILNDRLIADSHVTYYIFGKSRWDGVKPGPWTMDWTVDWTMDWTVDCSGTISLASLAWPGVVD